MRRLLKHLHHTNGLQFEKHSFSSFLLHNKVFSLMIHSNDDGTKKPIDEKTNLSLARHSLLQHIGLGLTLSNTFESMWCQSTMKVTAQILNSETQSQHTQSMSSCNHCESHWEMAGWLFGKRTLIVILSTTGMRNSTWKFSSH